MSVTLKDVADRAGVSRSAVSRTFTDGASVSARMREKVERIANEMGYQPNALASGLTTGRTKLIGLISNNFHNPIFLQVFDLFTRGLQERGLRPLLVNLSNEIDPLKSVRMVQQYSVDGVIVASSTLSPDFARAFKAAGIPVVHSFGRYTNTPKVHVVGIDNIECGRMAARELISCGYRQVGFLGGPADATSTQDRFKGFREELAAHPTIELRHSFAPAYSFDAGRAEMLRLVAEGLAEAYFCGDDVLTIGALSALQSAGKRVPDEIGLIGLNDMEMAGWENINLTTIHQPIQKIVNASLELVVSELHEPEPMPIAQLFTCHVVRRGTLPGRQ
ncbi:MAG: LacI family DNA-binding transcriptional regulator [Pseudomonadota bacterium]